MTKHVSRLIETDFPIEPVSAACAAEKSIRQEHISTLQMWWARRPLGVCRSAIFAALCPTPAEIDASKECTAILNRLAPGSKSSRAKLLDVTARLATWEATRDRALLAGARELLAANKDKAPLVIDTFAGGGSFPIEALRLGLDAFAGELNPVAVTALRTALHDLPAPSDELLDAYNRGADFVGRHLSKILAPLYGEDAKRALAYFWCLTFTCPKCGVAAPLLRDRWLARGRRSVAVDLLAEGNRFVFSVHDAKSSREKSDAAKGTVRQKGATCAKCGHAVSTAWLRERGCAGELGEQLYAKLEQQPGGGRAYSAVASPDEALAASAALRKVTNRRLREVPNAPFDPNGVRHLWAMQYGVTSTAMLYNRRQSVALLELAHGLDLATTDLEGTYSAEVVRAARVLLVLTFNRLVMYGTRHAWWQSNGEFPANMFGRQAIPMVWNYVEMPPHSDGAAGWGSARVWVAKVARHLTQIPKKGTVHLGDAASVPLESGTVDLVTIDPPYFDSITYAYLADVFYAWMRPLLGAGEHGDFIPEVSPKAEEAIVDRKHTLAPAPKSAAHFKRKMSESLKEARRVLKPNGRLLLMYGHKKAEAWEAVLRSLFDAGFVPTASWPVHTERKAKFRHGKVAALSTSCLLVCEPAALAKSKRQALSWNDFTSALAEHLRELIQRFEANHVLGTDLATSLLAPACALFARHDVRAPDDSILTVRELLARLPAMVQTLELDGVLSNKALQSDVALTGLVQKAVGVENVGEVDRLMTQWLREAREQPAAGTNLRAGATYAMDLLDGRAGRADELWSSLTPTSQDALQAFFRALSLIGPEAGSTRQLADTALGRISLSSRAP